MMDLYASPRTFLFRDKLAQLALEKMQCLFLTVSLISGQEWSYYSGLQTPCFSNAVETQCNGTAHLLKGRHMLK